MAMYICKLHILTQFVSVEHGKQKYKPSSKGGILHLALLSIFAFQRLCFCDLRNRY